MPVFLTEFAYAAKGKTAVKESTRAKYYKQAFQIALKNPRVAQLCQYALVIPPRKNGGYPNATGIVALNNKPLPTFNALASWAAKADGNGKIDAPGEACFTPLAIARAASGAERLPLNLSGATITFMACPNPRVDRRVPKAGPASTHPG